MIVKLLSVSMLLKLPTASVILIVQAAYVPSASVKKVMVLVPAVAAVVLLEHPPP